MSSSGAGSKRGRGTENHEKNSNELTFTLKMPSFSVITEDMCLYCLHVLYHYLNNKDDNRTPHSFPNHSYPIFVTWKTNDQNLRGCIGTFSATRLHDGLKEYAIKSATQDERFRAITSKEFNDLHCSVSILLNFEGGSRYDDWEIGVHGIKISYTHGNKTYTATYLPQVAKEQEWNHQATIDALLRKAGFTQPINEDVRNRINLTRYQSEHISVPASEYLKALRGGYLAKFLRS